MIVFPHVSYQNAKNANKEPYMKKQNNIIKNVYYEYFCGSQAPKRLCTCKASYLRKANKITKNIPFECFFFFNFLCTNAKIHAKRPFRRNRTALPKMCILTVFEFLRYQNAKIHAKQPQWSNGTTLPETCHLGYFLSIGTKTLKKKKKWKNTIWVNKSITPTIPPKKTCYLSFFLTQQNA